MNHLHKFIILLSLLIISILSCSRMVIFVWEKSVSFYVSPDGNDQNIGTKEFPLLNIQTAVNRTYVIWEDDIPTNFNIYVKEGVYKPGAGLNPINVGLFFSDYPYERHLINLSGGWNKDFSSRTGYSTLDGTNGLYHILWVGHPVKMANFILKNGRATGSTNYNAPIVSSDEYNPKFISARFTSGGGLFLLASTSTFSNIIIMSNTSVSNGRQVSIYGGGNTLFINTLSSNDLYDKGTPGWGTNKIIFIPN